MRFIVNEQNHLVSLEAVIHQLLCQIQCMPGDGRGTYFLITLQLLFLQQREDVAIAGLKRQNKNKRTP